MANETQTEKSLWSREALDQAWQEYLEREAFSYDPQTDPQYARQKQLYTRQGKLAMEDTMGKAAALTGGYGNSYAQSVGQQIYGQYLQQLDGVIPELYDRAWKRYQAEGEALYDEIVLRQGMLAEESGSGSSGGGGGGYSNSGYSTDVVKAAQKAVGATADGQWGAESSRKALQYGFTSLKQVVENGLGITYDYVKKQSKKVLGYDRGLITEMDFLVARNNDGNDTDLLQYENYQAYLMDRLRQIYQ